MKKQRLLLSILVFAAGLQSIAQTFSPIGPGNYTLTSSTVVVSGDDIYADNLFMSGPNVYTFGRYSGSAWEQLGSWGGVIGINCAIQIGDDIYIGGNFTDAAGNADMDRIARWNITSGTWHALGGGLNGYVTEIIQMGDDIIAAGKFTDAGGDVNADYIAKWDGSSWSAIGSQVVSTNALTVVSALAVHDGDLFVGGNFYSSNGGVTDFLAMWDGTSFTSVSGWTGQTGAVFEIAFDTNDNMYIGGEFPAKIAKYDGSNWDLMGNFTASGASWISDIEILGSTIFVGGKFTDAKGIAEADNIAMYDGSSWEAVGAGLNDEVYEITVSGSDLYIAGKFTDAGGNVAADKLVRYGTSSSTGLDEVYQEASFNIYPNPTSGSFNIESEKPGVFELLDISGKKLNTYDVRSTSFLVHEDLSPGIYFIRDLETYNMRKMTIINH